ncbi:Transmembrane protein [Aphelenchoides bicaudatus]|nr:Transmembrane protein [Aphelenchoides bicaudatus]
MPDSLVASLLYQFTLSGSIPGNGGQACVEYLPTWQKLVESAFFVPLCAYGLFWSLQYLEYPEENTIKNGSAKNAEIKKQLAETLPSNKVSHITLPIRNYIFLAYATVFFVEFIYKAITRTGIYFLNPCHICSLLQLILLKLPKESPLTTQVFRIQMYTMPGAILALMFPILNTRLLVGEVLIYYVQHLFIVATPIYLLTLENAFIPESTYSLAWPIFGMSSIILYHFLILQPLAVATSVNLNVILCPSLTDPFAGRFYRLCAVSHQCLIVPLVTKLYGLSTPYTAMLIQMYTQESKKSE